MKIRVLIVMFCIILFGCGTVQNTPEVENNIAHDKNTNQENQLEPTETPLPPTPTETPLPPTETPLPPTPTQDLSTGIIIGILLHKDTKEPISDFALGLRGIVENSPMMVKTKDGFKAVAGTPLLSEPILSDENGEFSFEGIPPGEYVIEHSAFTIKDSEGLTLIVLVEAGKITNIGEVYVEP